MLNAMPALSVALKARKVKRQWPTAAGAVATLGVTIGLLVMALWSWPDGVAPAHGRNGNIDEIRVRAPVPTPARGVAVSPVAEAGGGPSRVGAQVAPEVGSGRGFKAIVAGLEHTCGILTSGQIRCWGNDADRRATPPDGSFQSVAPGVFHSCAIGQGGTIACWGRNSDGQSTPPSGTFVSVGTGEEHSCGLRANGNILCWGGNRDGVSEPPGGEFVSLDVGPWHSCAVRRDGAAICWGGNNDHGQAMPPEGVFRSVAAGRYHSCGILANGSVECWGNDRHGIADAPEGVFQSLSAGYYDTCGLREDGAIVCWGRNEFGQSSPMAGTFRSVSTHYGHTCGLRTDGVAMCWGRNGFGVLDFPGEPPPTGYTLPPVSNISVCSGPNAGEVVISWDAVPQAKYYRIGYVNMIQDYPRAKASTTGEWIEAFTYIDVNARNIPVLPDGQLDLRAEYILRRLVQGDRHAFTVLTSNDVVNTTQTISGTYSWPQNPRWRFLTVGEPEAGCGSASLKVRISEPGSSTVACEFFSHSRDRVQADAYWANFPVRKDGADLSGYRFTWRTTAADGSIISEFTHELEGAHKGTSSLDWPPPTGAAISFSLTPLYAQGRIQGETVTTDCQPANWRRPR